MIATQQAFTFERRRDITTPSKIANRRNGKAGLYKREGLQTIIQKLSSLSEDLRRQVARSVWFDCADLDGITNDERQVIDQLHAIADITRIDDWPTYTTDEHVDAMLTAGYTHEAAVHKIKALGTNNRNHKSELERHKAASEYVRPEFSRLGYALCDEA